MPNDPNPTQPHGGEPGEAQDRPDERSPAGSNYGDWRGVRSQPQPDFAEEAARRQGVLPPDNTGDPASQSTAGEEDPGSAKDVSAGR